MSRARTTSPRNTFMATVGARIKTRRDALGFPQPRVAAAIGFSVSNLSRIESGVNSFTVETLAKIAKILECEPGAFVNGVKVK